MDGGPEIRISGHIGRWQDFGFEQFDQEFRSLWAAGRPITFRINSLGGDVFESMAIYDLVRLSPVPTIGLVNGIAGSAAGWVFQACSMRRMTRNSFLMIHKVQGCGCGTSGELRETADMSDKLERKIRQIYYERSAKSRPTVDSWFKDRGEAWFDAHECVKLGLADEVLAPAAEAHEGYLPVSPIHSNRLKMDFKDQVAKAFGLNAADETALLAELTRRAANQKSLDERSTALEQELGVLKDKLKSHEDAEAARQKELADQAEALLLELQNKGVLNQGQKDIFSGLAKKDPKMVLELASSMKAPAQRSLAADLDAARSAAQAPAAPRHEAYGDAVAAYLSAKHQPPKP